MNKIACFIVSLLTVATNMSGQNVAPVVIHDDHSATISVRFPGAEEVLIKGTFQPKARTYRTPAGVFGKEGKAKMSKAAANGLWTYTTSPLLSEMYTYNFEVADKDTFDINNPNRDRDIDTWLNFFIIPGGIGDNYLTKNVPHGKISLVWYNSTIPNLPRRRMAVYTPPEYSNSKKYPTLYLFHGTGGDEKSWMGFGRVQQILDNLIAQKRCKPMVVVMPNGIANRAATPGEDPYNNTPASSSAIESMLGMTESTFVHDVVEYIESHYSVIPQKKGRAIAGLSLGGLHTLFISANNPKTFDYVGLFSAQTTNAMTSRRIGQVKDLASAFDKVTDVFPFLSKKGNKIDTYSDFVNCGSLSVYDSLDTKLEKQFGDHPKLYYIAYGKDDFVKKLNEDFRKKLDAYGFKYTLNLTDGGHTWENWRKYLVDFLPRLFNE